MARYRRLPIRRLALMGLLIGSVLMGLWFVVGTGLLGALAR